MLTQYRCKMICLPLALTFYTIIISTVESIVDYSDHIVVKIIPNRAKDLDILKQLETKFDLDFWTHPRLDLSPILTDLSRSQLGALTSLKQANITYEIVSNNFQHMIDTQRQQSDSSYYANTFSFESYHTYSEVVAELNDIVQTNRSNTFTKVFSIGLTYENRSIPAITISNGESSANKKEVMLECGIHAREWISIAACLWIINDLLNNSTNSQRLDKFDFLVVPILNSDGYEYTWTTDRKWRKTRSVSTKSTECRGADPNRNWDSEFCKMGATDDPCAETYCGDKPFSEIEAQAMAKLIAERKDKIAAYFAFHSFSQLWMYPWGYTRELPPNNELLHKLSHDAVEAIKATNGLDFKYGTIANTIYEASGSSVDWAYDTVGVKIAFGMELRDTGHYGFLLPADQIKDASLEIWNGIKAVIDQI